MKRKTIPLLAAGIPACGILAGSLSFLRLLTKPQVSDREQQFLRNAGYGTDYRAFYESLERKPFSFQTSRGEVLQGEILPPAAGTGFSDGKQRAVLLIHGYTDGRLAMLAFAELFHRLGFSTVIYDQRYHGDSTGKAITMGWLEHWDAVELAEYVRGLFPADTVWGIAGESMGAATVMLAAPKLPWLRFVCEDCGYSTLREECRASVRYKTRLPGEPFTFLTGSLLRLWPGYNIDRVRPIDAVGEIPQPMLFVHGGADRFVPTEMVYRLCDRKKGPKKLQVFEGVPHAKSALMRHEEYYGVMKEFLEKYRII